MTTPDTTSQDHLLSNKVYDVLKFIALIFLPAAATLYAGLATIWGLPSPEHVVSTIIAVDTFLGALLGIATKSYNNSEAKYDGNVVITDLEDGAQKFLLEVNSDLDHIRKQNSFNLKVVKK